MPARWLVLAIAAVVLTGCSGSPDREPTPAVTVTRTVTSPAEPTPDVPTQDVPTQDLPTPDVPTPDERTQDPSPSPAVTVPQDAIAESAGDRGGLFLEVYELRRAGDTVVLNFGIRNDTGEDVDFGINEFVRPEDVNDTLSFFTMSGVSVTDDVNGNRHLTLAEPDGTCVCSFDVDELGMGETGAYYALFAAPPEDAEEMSVQVPNFGSVTVPLS